MLSNLVGFSQDTLVSSLKSYVSYNQSLFGAMTLKYLAIAAAKKGYHSPPPPSKKRDSAMYSRCLMILRSYGLAVGYLQKASREMTQEPTRAETTLVGFFRIYRDERVFIQRICEKYAERPLPPFTRFLLTSFFPSQINCGER